MRTTSIKPVATIALALLAASAAVAAAAGRQVALTQAPLVMRLSKDEFRIAFGINAAQATTYARHGVIHYRVDWKTEDGDTRSELRRVNYTLAPRTSRSIAVDRQYFDTAEGQHTTEILRVNVDGISCWNARDGQIQLANVR